MVNDGGPAFPIPASEVNRPDPGMSLRDWFAGRIINGILSSYEYKRDAKDGAMLIRDSTCEAAYKLADAMLKAREVPDAK